MKQQLLHPQLIRMTTTITPRSPQHVDLMRDWADHYWYQLIAQPPQEDLFVDKSSVEDHIFKQQSRRRLIDIVTLTLCCKHNKDCLYDVLIYYQVTKRETAGSRGPGQHLLAPYGWQLLLQEAAKLWHCCRHAYWQELLAHSAAPLEAFFATLGSALESVNLVSMAFQVPWDG